MFYLRIKDLIQKILKNFLKKIISTEAGSFLFYNIVLKRRLGMIRIKSLIGKNLNILAKYCTNLIASKELRKLSNKAKSIEEIIDLSFSFQFFLPKIPLYLFHKVRIDILQNRFEISEFLKLIDTIKPKVILEIGTAMGGTLYVLSRFSSSNSLLISVDLPIVKVGDIILPANPSFYKSFVQKNQKVVLIKGNSHDFSTFHKIENILKNRKIDLLFIDGDHTYEGVKKDFEMYKSLVKPGGLICLHDIVPGSYSDVGDVPNFWNRIREKYDSREIVQDWSQGGFGIGIIFIT